MSIAPIYPKERGSHHGKFILGIDRGFAIEGKAEGHESSDLDNAIFPCRARKEDGCHTHEKSQVTL